MATTEQLMKVQRRPKRLSNSSRITDHSITSFYANTKVTSTPIRKNGSVEYPNINHNSTSGDKATKDLLEMINRDNKQFIEIGQRYLNRLNLLVDIDLTEVEKRSRKESRRRSASPFRDSKRKAPYSDKQMKIIKSGILIIEALKKVIHKLPSNFLYFSGDLLVGAELLNKLNKIDDGDDNSNYKKWAILDSSDAYCIYSGLEKVKSVITKLMPLNVINKVISIGNLVDYNSNMPKIYTNKLEAVQTLYLLLDPLLRDLLKSIVSFLGQLQDTCKYEVISLVKWLSDWLIKSTGKSDNTYELYELSQNLIFLRQFIFNAPQNLVTKIRIKIDNNTNSKKTPKKKLRTSLVNMIRSRSKSRTFDLVQDNVSDKVSEIQDLFSLKRDRKDRKPMNKRSII